MQINLNGMWKATADLGAQAKAGKPGYNDASWSSVPVPGHWQQAPGLESHAGTLLYRRTFMNDHTLAPGETARLCFEGLFYAAKVWLNGAFLGEHRGYFTPAQYDCSKHLRQGENIVMVELESPAEKDLTAKRQITGVFGDWECKPPNVLPGGIWRDVSLRIYHGVVPERFALSAVPDRLPAAPLAPDELAAGDAPAATEGPITGTVSFEMEFAAVGEGTLTWTATVTPETFAGEPVLLQGSQATRRGWNRLEASLRVNEPRLWWTWDHGAPDLYRFKLELRHEGGPVQTIERLFGIRKVELRKWHFYLNGRRLFIRGTNYGPADIRIATVRREQYQQDLDLMIGANMNMARVHAHIAKPDLYEEASRKGMLIWQDFPLHRLYSRSILDEAKRQVRTMVDLLGHWPAVAVWCSHNDPVRGAKDESSFFNLLSGLTGNWNKSTLAPALRDVIRQQDPTRPVIAHSGDWGVLRGGTDTHHYWGWYQGKIEDLPKVLKTFPDTARFVTEFGSQAFPNPEHSRRFVRGNWPNINWSDLNEKHMLQPKNLEKYVPHSLAQTFEQYVGATQQYQAYLHKFFIEHFRKLKYNPCGGVLQYLFTDSAPGVTWSIIDYWRAPKLAYKAVQEAFRPVTIIADWPQSGYAEGAKVGLRVYLVNDSHQRVTGSWSWAVERGGETLASATHRASVGSDALALAPEAVEWTVPPGLGPGTVDLVLTLHPDGQEPIVNRYAFAVLPPS